MALSESEELELLQLERDRAGGGPKPMASPTKKSGILGSAWEDLKTPEKMSREGLGMLTDIGVKGQNWLANKTGLPIGTEPTGNMTRDVIANTPRIVGETLKEVAPGFVSRGSIVTGGLMRGAGAAAKAIAPTARLVGKTLESTSGLRNVPVKTPGLLTEAFEDPKLMFGMGTKKAGELYGNLSNVRDDLKLTEQPMRYVRRALGYANQGTLTPDEAIKARRELDGIKENVTGDYYAHVRGILDKIAKTDHSGADAAYVKGMKSDALRNLTSINKNGTPSKLDTWMTLFNPKAAALTTPFVQAAGASALGAAAKAGSSVAKSGVAAAVPGLAEALLRLREKKKEEKRGK